MNLLTFTKEIVNGNFIFVQLLKQKLSSEAPLSYE